MKRILLSSALAAAIIFMIAFAGCSNLYDSFEASERRQIDEYLKTLEDTIFEKKSSGLYYIEITPGTGNLPVNLDTVYFRFKGYLLDHQVFTSNFDQPAPYKYVIGTGLKSGEIITGIDEGLRYIKPGGLSKVILPSKLAFGPYGYGMAIPGYTPVYYVLKIDSLHQGPSR